METQGEELSRLRAEHTSFLQLVAVKDQLLASKDAQLSTVIASKDEVIASKNQLLASRTAELQRCMALLQHSISSPASDAATPDSSKRQRLLDSSAMPLDRDELLDHVFSYVGGGDHIYVGGVSRRWRGRYLRHCIISTTGERNKKFVTRSCNVLISASRLQLALNCGLSVADWSFAEMSRAALLCEHSIEPEQVLSLLKCRGVQWHSNLCYAAAYNNRLTLLQWLHEYARP
jgi:hypothetical protein